MLPFVPETLQFSICSLCPPRSKPKDVKIAAIGQALIKLARPNTILCPLLLAFAAEMHNKSGGSEFAVQLLHSMGFGSNIEKVRKLEKSLCFDKNTLHMMGIIRSVVKQSSMQHKPILKKYPTKEDLLKFAIPIKHTGKIDKSEILVVLKPINSFNIITGNENMASICDLFISTASLCRSVSE